MLKAAVHCWSPTFISRDSSLSGFRLSTGKCPAVLAAGVGNDSSFTVYEDNAIVSKVIEIWVMIIHYAGFPIIDHLYPDDPLILVIQTLTEGVTYKNNLS